MPDSICKKCNVRGRVQGVFFRASAAEVAGRLGLTGHALNLPDGSVEVLACGPPDSVAEFCQWLKHGPRSAIVERLDCAQVTVAVPERFRTG